MPLRNDLNGFRVKVPNEDPIYLVDEGRRRHIPNPDTYNKLFAEWKHFEDNSYREIDLGTEIENGASLTRGHHNPKVYLIESGMKRWIVSPEVFNRYGFDWKKILELPDGFLSGIKDGPNIE